MEHVKKIFVSMQLDEDEIELGEMVSEGKNIYFKYYAEFISRGLEISPFKLKLNSGIYKAEPISFDGLFGVFADSLPDGWGKLLLERALTARGITIDDITILDRLAYVGSSGMGALIYKPEIEIADHDKFKIELDDIAKATNQIISGTTPEILDELFKLGGSSGGARPKILVGYNPRTQHIMSDANILPIGYEHWIIKFPSSADSHDIANIEYAYYKMAVDAGIVMNESKLFHCKSGKAFFGTKRFDRIGNKRIHMHSAAGIMHDNFRYSNLDYGHLMDCAFTLENDVRAYEKILRLAAFNVFAHNRDDHSKNFSFLMDANGKWKVAPAYDLTFSGSAHGMHSTMIDSESLNPTKKHLMELADYFKVKNASAIIDHVQSAVYNWNQHAKQCEVSKDIIDKIEKVILRKA